MTVAELQNKLEGLDPRTYIVVNHEIDGEMYLLERTDASLATNSPRRHEDTRKAGFTFEKVGPATWLFVSTEEA
jgi:hypothetical protein